MENSIGVLVYVSFGSGRHVAEITASMLSALAYASVRDGRVRIVVATDDASHFARLPVEAIVIPPELAAEWRGTHGYVFNVKIRAMQFVLEKLNISTAMIDGDTYFRRDPALLFARIGPGQTIMHLRESALGELPNPAQLALRDALQGHTYATRSGDEMPLGNGMPVWNSGVVGCHPSDAPLIEDVLGISATVHSLVKAHITEQLAFAAVFDRYTRLSPCSDIVFHYWSQSIRDPFTERLPSLLDRLKHLPIGEQAEALRSEFPYYRAAYRAKRYFRNRILVPLGLRQKTTPMS